MISPRTLEALLRRAADEILGLVVETNNVNALTQQINNDLPGIRDELNISICKPALPNTIFIVKRSAELTQ